MRLSKKILLAVATCVILAAALGRYFIYVPVMVPPELSGTLTHHVLDVGELERRFAVYWPVQSLESAAAVIMLHGSRGSGKRIRRASGYEFDMLADRDGFIVVYPEALGQHWNDCRIAGDNAAQALPVDDVAFMRVLIAFIIDEYTVARRKVFVAGVSNGGQMAYRLALEAPDLVRGVAAIAASLPLELTPACTPTGKAVPVMIVNGSADPINPYTGGEVTLAGWFGDRGVVRSAPASAQYWADLAGYANEPFFHRYPDSDADDGSVANRMVWSETGRAEVALVTVDGGGHTIPGPGLAFPRFLGAVNRDFSAVDEIWRFFSRQSTATDP